MVDHDVEQVGRHADRILPALVASKAPRTDPSRDAPLQPAAMRGDGASGLENQNPIRIPSVIGLAAFLDPLRIRNETLPATESIALWKWTSKFRFCSGVGVERKAMNTRILSGLITITFWAANAEDPDELIGRTEDSLAATRAEILQPLQELNANYEQALNKLLAQLQAEGDLDGMLATKKELENFERRMPEADDEGSADSPLGRIRAIYESEYTKVMNAAKAAEIQAIRAEITELSLVVAELTKKGELESAIQVKGKIDELEEQLESMMDPKKSDLTNPDSIVLVGDNPTEEYISKGVQKVVVTQTEEGLVLTSGGNNTHIATARSLKSPFRIATRAKTDSNDIRIHVGARGAIVLSSKERPGQLWMHHPVEGSKVTADEGTGELKLNEFHEIEILVKDDRIELEVNGKSGGFFLGDFSEVVGSVGIGPAHSAKVTVSSFLAEPIKE